MYRSFTPEEEELIFALAEQLTGTSQKGRFRRDVLLLNISRRMDHLGQKDLSTYIELAGVDRDEAKQLVSALTIHTTFWFREAPHFDLLRKTAEAFAERKPNRPFALWSAASSTGEELYTSGLVLEEVRRRYPGFDYELHGSDIDPLSIATAQRAIYRDQCAEVIPADYRKLVLVGTGKAEGWMTLDPEIRKRSLFFVNNLAADWWMVGSTQFDFIFCRNVLIYFAPESVQRIVEKLGERLQPDGVLCLGHSELLEQVPKGIYFHGQGSYSRKPSSQELKAKKSVDRKRRVLVVDDSKVIRKVIGGIFSQAGYEVLEASSARQADAVVAQGEIDFVTLDIHMPEEDGPTWLERVRRDGFAAPVVLVTDANSDEAQAVIGALERHGAQDYVLKAHLHDRPRELLEMARALIQRTEDRSEERPMGAGTSERSPQLAIRENFEVLLVGASTGGPETLCRLLKQLPKEGVPPVLVVQHISGTFAQAFAERLARASGLTLAAPVNGAPLEPGHLYMAWSDVHIEVARSAGRLLLKIQGSPPLHGHRPAVDALFHSAAQARVRSVAVLLTGMGRDGAAGMLELHRGGASLCIAQDEKSCVVYGMPREAVRLNATHAQMSPNEIRAYLDRCFQRKVTQAA